LPIVGVASGINHHLLGVRRNGYLFIIVKAFIEKLNKKVNKHEIKKKQ
jgi:hypothetical protein